MNPSSLYQPLEGNEIRLLTIHSESNFTLEKVCLGNGPKYDAISYCWGDAEDLCQVQINGYEFPLRRHVSAMLGSLYYNHRVTRVWLDMVCINQDKLTERKKQVSITGKIYNRAQTVYAWLGEADPEIECIFDVLLAFRDEVKKAVLPPDLDAAERLASHRELFHEIYLKRAGSFPKHNKSDDEKLHEEFNWLRPLYARPYWGRLWIVQELILAKKVIICCGVKSIDLHDIYGLSLEWGSFEQGFDNPEPKPSAALIEIAHRLPTVVPEQEDPTAEFKISDESVATVQHSETSTAHNDTSEEPKPKPEPNSRGWKTILSIRGHRRRRELLKYETGGRVVSPTNIAAAGEPPRAMIMKMKKRGEVARFDEALQVYVHHGCKCPKDKVYGLRELIPQWKKKLVVDYEKSVLDVFLDAARCGLFEQRKLGGLHVAFGLWSEMGLGDREKFNDCVRLHFPDVYSRDVSKP